MPTSSWVSDRGGPRDYRRYLDVLADWSTQLSLHRGEVEELIFREGISREGLALWGMDAPVEPAEIGGRSHGERSPSCVGCSVPRSRV